MTIRERLQVVRERIAVACSRAGRDPESVTLVAVSKTHPPESVREAYAAGQRRFGENYVQGLVRQAEALRGLDDLTWHFIGHLQRNKAKSVVAVRAVMETLDSARLARALDGKAEAAGVRVRCLVQVNVGGEAQKSGVEPGQLGGLLDEVRPLASLDVVGLMTVPPRSDGPEDARPHFATLRGLAETHGLTELSMGMSGDLEVAVEEGATIVRVGTAIFGPRQPPASAT